jgi:ubiquinol-cytochrome c reductase cytochrome b subunit
MWSSVLNNHFSFYLSPLTVSYAYTFGFLLSLLFILQFLSGLLLSCYYSPFIAFSSVHYIMIDVNVGWFVRFFHVLGASLFMFFILIHMIRGTWIRLKMIEQIDFSSLLHTFYVNLIWVSGGLILGLCLCTGFFGYILNWGQMSYWGITVIINMLSIIPLFGSYIGDFLWCSSLVIVNRIFVFHFSLGFIIGLLILVHIALLHTFSSSNPLTNNNSIIIPFYALFFKDCFVSYVISLFFCFYLFWEPDVFGNCDNLIFANPLSTPNHILPEWYFLIYYCCLRSFPNKTMGVIIVFLFVLLWV